MAWRPSVLISTQKGDCSVSHEAADKRISFVLEQYRVVPEKLRRTPAFVIAPAATEQARLPLLASRAPRPGPPGRVPVGEKALAERRAYGDVLSDMPAIGLSFTPALMPRTAEGRARLRRRVCLSCRRASVLGSRSAV